MSTPQPLRALRTLIREARKAEQENFALTKESKTAGEIIYGSVTYTTSEGTKVKHLHRMAIEFDNFIDAANQYEQIVVPELEFTVSGFKRRKKS